MARRSIRRGQAISPFGVGSLVDFPGESLLAAGLDAWPEEPECRLLDDRLQRRLAVAYFRQPPPWTQREQRFLPFVRFPLWHFCPRCRRLAKVKANDLSPPRCSNDQPPRHGERPACGTLPEKRRPRLLPVRFLVACEEGHVDDFPWIEWVHGERRKGFTLGRACEEPVLFLESAGHGGLRGVLIRCTGCRRSRTLVGAGGPRGLADLKCMGKRPWLGDSMEPCGQLPQMLQRGATRLYFPRRISSILIPPYSARLYGLLENQRVRRALDLDGTETDVHPEAIKAVAREHRVDSEDLAVVIARSREQSADQDELRPSEADYRYDEYQALLSRTPDLDGNLVVSQQPLDQYDPLVALYFDRLVLVEKLAETQALIGFSRITPSSRPPDEVQWSHLSRRCLPWLPAYRVFGEGIFLTLRRDALGRWRHQAEVMEAAERIQRHSARRSHSPGRQVTPELLVLHSLAHLLIRRLSFECGYGASSLRERLYCRTPPGAYSEDMVTSAGRDGWMCGLLVYTAAGDSEGTLGGLVHQGKPGRFEAILKNALSEALWCASDPLCRESTGQGSDSLNLAACHTCTLLPETSCEEGNRFLDRLLVVGGTGEGRPGFFGKLVEELLSRGDKVIPQ
jgi:MrfA Zn-binding domain